MRILRLSITVPLVALLHSLANARYYDSHSGRYITQDPVGFKSGDANLYRYSRNNPTNAVDPTGESATLIGGAVGVASGLGYAGYRALFHEETFNWGYIAQGALAGTAVGFGIDTLGTGSGFSAALIAGSGIGSGLGGAAGSVSSQGSWSGFGRGILKGGVLGGIGGATGYGIGAAGLSTGWAFAGSVAADTYTGVVVDRSFGDCSNSSDCFASNAAGSLLGNGIGYGAASISKNLSRMGIFSRKQLTPDGKYYSAAYEMTLKPNSYPGISRARHFQEANEELLRYMEKNPDLAVMLEKDLGIKLERTARQLAPRDPPSGWVWHHHVQEGKMRLVPKSQHAPGSSFWEALHPDGRGGYAIWGKTR
jgi:hypothetical protein